MSSPLFVGKLIESHATRGVVEFEGKRVPISISLIPDAEIGDEVLVQYGFGLRRMSEASESEPGFSAEMDLPPSNLSLDL